MAKILKENIDKNIRISKKRRVREITFEKKLAVQQGKSLSSSSTREIEPALFHMPKSTVGLAASRGTLSLLTSACIHAILSAFFAVFSI